MAKRILKLGPGTRIDTPWPLEILAQDGWPVPVFMVKGGPDARPIGWVPKVEVLGWLADAGIPARIAA